MQASGFECRLSPDEHRVDFATWVTPEGGGIQALGLAVSSDGAGILDRRPEWHRMAEFSRWWAKPESEPARCLDFMILEFDTDRSLEYAVVPSLFLGLAPRARLLAGLERPSPDHLEWLTDRALPRLRGGELPRSIVTQLRSCYMALPPGGAFLHAASMLSRDTEAVRIYATVPISGVPRYLHEIGCEDAAPDLLRVWRGCAGDASRLPIQFDVGVSIGKRVSVELPLRSALSGRQGLSEQLVFDYLEREGLCAPEKRRALLAWPEVHVVDPPSHASDEIIVKELSHAKVARDASGELEAKAYFYFTHTDRSAWQTSGL